MRSRFTSVLRLSVSVLILACVATPAYSGEIWTDGNGDGLPDLPGTLSVPVGDEVQIDVWIDAQSFTWTNFLAYVEWDGNCFEYVSAQYTIAGGSNFPIDRFSHPSAVGFGGFGYTQSGVDRIGSFTVQLVAQVACCMTPIIDPKNPYGVFSQLGSGAQYFLFTSNPGSCYSALPGIESCCFPDGSCVEAETGACPAGSTPRGPGTRCTDPCPLPTGACCFPSGACTSPLSRNVCEAQGGTYQGDGTDCGTVACAVPTGACCFTNGTCQDGASRDDCESAGGNYKGDGTACVNGECPRLPGACCFEVDQCMVITELACADSGGIFFGEGTECANSGECPIQTGACCTPTGTCLVRTREQCEAAGNVYQGNAVPCVTGLCPDLRGACCFPTGTCTFTSEAQCVSQGGVFQGIGTTCAQVICPDYRGACCFPDGLCALRLEAQCASQGGVFRGIGTTCAQADCPQPIVACCFPQSGACADLPRNVCDERNGVPNLNTTCAQISCPQPPLGACCLPDRSCIPDITRLECEIRGGTRWDEGGTCDDPSSCDIECGSYTAMSQLPISVREANGSGKQAKPRKSGGKIRAPEASSFPCLLADRTNGTAANYRWYNTCSGYVWIYSNWCPGEGVGVLFGGPAQPEVRGGNTVKRAITYYRNIRFGYTVNVFVDVDKEGDGCPDSILASDISLEPGLRWNCSEFGVDIPCDVEHLIVRTVYGSSQDPGYLSFATDGPFSETCDPEGVARSFYYGYGDVCLPWEGGTKRNDNFLYWLVLDQSDPCPVTATESTSWGRIKALFR